MTFVPYTCRIYGRILRVMSGFGNLGSRGRMQTPPMRWQFVRAGTFLTASFRPRLTTTPLLFG